MERPNYESMASLLKDRPLPWKIIPGTHRPNESWIVDNSGRSVMLIRTSLQNHQPVLDLLYHLVLDRMPDSKWARTVPQMVDEIVASQAEIGTAIGESMKEFGTTVPDPFNSSAEEQ